MNKTHDPPTVCKPFSNYSNAVEVASGARWLLVSGQIGVDVSGRVEPGFEAQCRRAFGNIGVLLSAAGMDFDDLVKLSVFLTRPQDLGEYRRIRDDLISSRPASSLVFVAGLAHPDWLVEIEAVAAR